MRSTCCFVLVPLLLGCTDKAERSDAAPDTAPPTADTSETSAPDADPPDIATPDTNTPDTATPDTTTPEVAAPDADTDGVPDAVDVCPTLSDPAQRDFDGDGIGDACDADADGDGLADPASPPEMLTRVDLRDFFTEDVCVDGSGALTSDDPYDCATRGLSVRNLVTHQRHREAEARSA